MDRCFFSVIIPVYNTPKAYLDACVASICAQEFEDMEILLVDDGSANACAACCDGYAQADSRVRVIHQTNQGVSTARNRGIQEAKGTWILFVDADDWIEANTCQILASYLADYTGDLLMFNAINEDKDHRNFIHFDWEDGRIYNMSDAQTRELIYRKAMRPQSANGKQNSALYYCWDKAYKTSFLQKNHLAFPVGLPKSEDKVFILNCLEKADSFYYVNDAIYHYRINEESVCHKYSAKADKDRMHLAEVLYPIATRMDQEMAELTGNENYNLISADYYRFLFGIISDVLLLKYYHADNPESRKMRHQAARKFVKTEPFLTAIKKCSYSELSTEAKLKKFLLSKGMVSEFILILKLYSKMRRVIRK